MKGYTQIGFWDTVHLHDTDGKHIDWVIGINGVVRYANKFEKCESLSEALRILERNEITLRVSSRCLWG